MADPFHNVHHRLYAGSFCGPVVKRFQECFALSQDDGEVIVELMAESWPTFG